MTERETEIILTFGPATLDQEPSAPWLWSIDEWAEGEHVVTLVGGRAPTLSIAEHRCTAAIRDLGLDVVGVDAPRGDIGCWVYRLGRRRSKTTESNGPLRAEVGL